MCGIVGFLKNDCLTDIYNGLVQLEYRGYDSAGIAFIKNNRVITVKQQGKVAELKPKLPDDYTELGIGHTRWATHGKPSNINSHPHSAGHFTIVHNGIIENFLELKIMLVNCGACFLSDTDTEVIAHLLEYNYDKDFLKTLIKTRDMLVGSYALAIISSNFPNTVALMKKENPLIVGKGKDFFCFASDSPALVKHTDTIYKMQDGDIALLTKETVKFYKESKEVTKNFITTPLKQSQLEKGMYESYMLKEIDEIPNSMAASLACIQHNGLDTTLKDKLPHFNKVQLIGCGTAYHACMYGKYLIEKIVRIPAVAEIASEFRYREPLIDKNTLVIAVSQSGETADTLCAVKTAKKAGAYIVAITNVPASSLTNLADTVLLTLAGAEIAVAATKSYNTQLTMLYYITTEIAKTRGIKSNLENSAKLLRITAETVLNEKHKVIELTKKYSESRNVFFLGRWLDYTTALEGSLKLKEISYIHGEGCPSGEIKHGTLALITKDTLVINIITCSRIKDKSMNALHEVKTRGAKVLLITCFEDLINDSTIDDYILLPRINETLAPLISIIPIQLFSYYTARARGNDPDKPRNLAKSVTVE